MSKTIEVDQETLQVAFDVAVGSMNFGSGFLCDDEVSALRTVAVALAVDPDVATPKEFKCKYRGAHEPNGGDDPKYARVCRFCRLVVA